MLGSLKDGLQKSYYKDEDYRTHVMINKEKGFGQGDQERVMPRQAPTGNNAGFGNNNNNNNRSGQQYPQGVSQNYKGQYPIPGFNRGFYNNNNNIGTNQPNTHTHTHTNNYLPDGRRASQMGPRQNAIGHTPVFSLTQNISFSHKTPLTKPRDTNLIHKNLIPQETLTQNNLTTPSPNFCISNLHINKFTDEPSLGRGLSPFFDMNINTLSQSCSKPAEEGDSAKILTYTHNL
eukprot:GHVR01110462.1.p2 GENE.GHVR01110462.1~~GHVR01110462.1.p2  ORF type:complete len:233 (+),score=45.03 GHVR01110462.1:4391-5089(+)